jgi:thiaminase/transcriptional activator TenA
MTKLSEIALEKCTLVIQAIKKHPFNVELAAGTLALDKFAYYIEQDTLYLRDFARSLAMIAARAPLKFIKDFLSFSDGALIAEQEVVHSFFRESFNFQETGKLSPSTVSYTSYLLQNSATAPVEVAIATVLPCFWIYKIIGDSIAENIDAKSQNPYLRWIKTYSSEEFGESVKKAINIFDEVALSTSDAIRQSMVDTFYKSTVLEWWFWNDSYNQTIFDSFA